MYRGNTVFLKSKYNKIKKITYKNLNGFEKWYEYDEQGNEIHYKDQDGYEIWYEYDEQGNQISFKDSDGYER